MLPLSSPTNAYRAFSLSLRRRIGARDPAQRIDVLPGLNAPGPHSISKTRYLAAQKTTDDGGVLRCNPSEQRFRKFDPSDICEKDETYIVEIPLTFPAPAP
jgi:hypothetical protein